MRVSVADARAAGRSDAATVNVRLLLTELEALKKRKQAEQSEVLKKKK